MFWLFVSVGVYISTKGSILKKLYYKKGAAIQIKPYKITRTTQKN